MSDIHHIRRDDVNGDRTWCMRKITPFMWVFQDIDHAVFNGEMEGRLVACKRCVARIIKALRNGHK